MKFIQHLNLKDPIMERADFNADVIPGRSIVIYGQSGRRRTDEEGRFSLRFEIGGRAVSGSYNLVYTGIITGIGEKSVTIKDDEGTKRLDLVKFIRYNWNFDAKRIDRENDAEMVCI